VALDKSFTGRGYPPGDVYEVGREKIREFADAVGADSPLHRDPEAAREAGYADVIAPPTFAVIISMKANSVVVDDPELGLDFSRVVHGSQSFTHHRPVTAGDRLVAEVFVDDVQTRMGNDFLTVRAEISTVDGERVTTSTGLLVSRGEDA
jgi:acyl dehydratase